VCIKGVSDQWDTVCLQTVLSGKPILNMACVYRYSSCSLCPETRELELPGTNAAHACKDGHAGQRTDYSCHQILVGTPRVDYVRKYLTNERSHSGYEGQKAQCLAETRIKVSPPFDQVGVGPSELAGVHQREVHVMSGSLETLG
jgi:hypothetical protein